MKEKHFLQILCGLLLLTARPLHSATLFSEDFESYPDGTSLSDAGWTMCYSTWSGFGHIQITTNTGFGSTTRAVHGATGGGRGGYIAAYKSFTQRPADGQLLTLTASVFCRTGQGNNQGMIGFFDGTVHGGGNGDPRGVRVETAATNWFLNQSDGARTFFGPALTADGIYRISVFIDGQTDTFWATVVTPDMTEYTSGGLPLTGKFETDMSGVQLYVKNFGGPVPDFDDIQVTAAGEPLPRMAIRVSQVELCWETVSNRTYQVQYRSSLTTNEWTDLGSPVPGDDARKCVTDSVLEGAPQRFYRLLRLP
jgi:hypothetical protein